MILFGERARQLSGLAARLLGWRPDEFWAATPTEMLSAIHCEEVAEPVGEGELRALMARFPDGTS